MIYLKSYKLFESVITDDQFFKTKDEISDWLSKMHIKKYTINNDLTVDTHEDEVNITHMQLDCIPVQFNIVKGIFYCNDNNLTSLKGSPKYLIPSRYIPSFYCYKNKLTSTEYCTPNIDSDFYCSNNNIFNLKGFPSARGIDITENPISRLIGRVQTLISDRKFELRSIEFIHHLNDFDVIKKNNIFLDKLEEVIDLMGFHFDFKEANKISDNFLGFTKLGYNIIE